ncbi:MAG: M18 family aminopeptidase [Desulfamplus sp.]|nr:M18 family aminopeptidase [Desulfamplus sp.]
MNQEKYNEDLFSFIKNSPTQYHAVANMAKSLSSNGFIELKEGDSWLIKDQSKYFVTRNGSAIIAFFTGENRPWESGIKLVCAHTDSPSLKIKPIPEIKTNDAIRLGVEVYGGVLLNSWFDRGLNLAGRVTALSADDEEKETLCTVLVNYDAPLAVIPSLAIHLDREANTKRVLNPQVDMPPLFSISGQSKKSNINQLEKSDLQNRFDSSSSSTFLGSSIKSFKSLLLEQAIKENSNIHIKEVLDFDMSFSDAQPPFFTGLNQEIISAPRLDNLLSCHAGLKSLVRADGPVPCILVCTDHEEVGSDTSAGARGSFLNSVLSRTIPDPEKKIRATTKSFMISLDNAHALHPAHCDSHDSNHIPRLNHGPVLKVNASHRYASDSESAALFRYICKLADIPLQTFVMRSDMPCGSTIGPAMSSATGIKTVDAGAPTLGMHAIRELTGAGDPFMVFQVLNHFFYMESQLLVSPT